MAEKPDIKLLGGIAEGERKKPKFKDPRHEIACQPVEERVTNYNEVALGYTPEIAVAEAMRCIECPQPRCMVACPVHIDIPGFIGLIARGKFAEAGEHIRLFNNLPAVCGRVCPQENLCEAACIINDTNKGNPIAIGRLERFCADWQLTKTERSPKDIHKKPATGFKVAVIGSGPSGLSCAADLAKQGHSVHLFEALHKAGGVLMYGIPEFRLPKEIVQKEIAFVQNLGVEIELNTVVGRTMPVQEVLDEFDAMYVASGAGYPNMMKIPGENLNGVYSANEFLTRVNLMKAWAHPEIATPVRRPRKAVVVGAGFTAFDVVRICLRLGAKEAQIVYRRSREEMPGRGEEIQHAEEEGAKLTLLTAPVQYFGDDKGYVKAVEVQKMKLGEPDSSGRRRPIPIEGSNYVIECDLVVVAIGQTPNVLIPGSLPGLATRWGSVIKVNRESYMTTVPKVFAGGDAITGAATVILATRAGREAARAIDAYVRDPNRAWHAPE